MSSTRIYMVEAYDDEPEPVFDVPMTDEHTRLVVRVRPRPTLFPL